MEDARQNGPKTGTVFRLLLLAGASFGFALVNLLPHETADEGFHAPAIWEYYHGNYGHLSPYLAMLPTYHMIMGWLVRQIGVWDISLLRAIHLLVSLLIIPVFSRTISILHPGEQQSRTAQLFFFPLCFPFFFLVYTDTWGLLMVLLMLLFTLERCHLCAALAGLLAVLFRQHNVVWGGFFLLLIALEQHECAGGASRTQLLTTLVAILRRGWLHLLVCAAFIVFAILNKGVAVGDRGSNPFVFHVTNFYTFLIWAWVLLLPSHCARLPQIGGLMRKPWIAAAVLAGLFVYLATYNNSHPLNQPGSYYYLRNKLLTVMTGSAACRTLLYIPIAWSLLSFACVSLRERRFLLLYLIGPVSIALMPIIEPRYYIPTFALFLVFRNPEKRAVETAQLGYSIVLSAILTYCIAHQYFFP